jgi:hypothetical protein
VVSDQLCWASNGGVPPRHPRLKRTPFARPVERGATIGAMITGSVNTMGEGREGRERAAPCRDERASQQKGWAGIRAGAVTGRPGSRNQSTIEGAAEESARAEIESPWVGPDGRTRASSRLPTNVGTGRDTA